MNLAQLQLNQLAVITDVSSVCDTRLRDRLFDLGFVKGASIQIERISPLSDPILYEIQDTHISLRKEDAKFIFIELAIK